MKPTALGIILGIVLVVIAVLAALLGLLPNPPSFSKTYREIEKVFKSPGRRYRDIRTGIVIGMVGTLLAIAGIWLVI